jgi:hypothetical protein
MCRTKELGGRRCPQHTDPVKHAAYNARRRELYAEKKKVMLPPLEEATTAEYVFPPLEEVRAEPSSYDLEFYRQDRADFSNSINPGWDADDSTWVHHRVRGPWKPETDKRDSVLYYTDEGYREIRDYLNGKTVTKPDEVNAIMSNLDSALEQAKPPVEPRRLYRGLTLPHDFEPNQVQDWLGENFPVGGVISQKNYMSTTLSPNAAVEFSRAYNNDYNNGKAVVFEIMSKQGAPVGEGLSYHDDRELEVLMKRNARFKVVAVHSVVSFHSKSYISTKNLDYTVVQLVDAD